MYTICMNDLPVAYAETEQKAREARAYIQRIWDLITEVDGKRRVFIHTHQVPMVETIEDFHNIFLQKDGGSYQYVLNLLSSIADSKPNPMVSTLKNEEAVEIFKKFRKTYPEIDEFIKRYRGEPEPINYWDVARTYMVRSKCKKRQYGCVIVRADGVVASMGCNSSRVPCVTCVRENVEHSSGDYAGCPAIHAKQMALMKAGAHNLKGAKLYLVSNDGLNVNCCPACQNIMNWYGVTQVIEPITHG